MPLPATAFEITWGGAPFREVRAIAISDKRGPPQARLARWSIGERTLILSAYAQPFNFENEYGRRRRLIVRRLSQPGSALTGGTTADINAQLTGVLTLFDYDCMWVDLETGAEANGVVFFDMFFRIMDTIGAPTAPVP